MRSNLSGQKFGMLTAIKYVRSDAKGNAIWECKCDCGNKVSAYGYDLQRGRVVSCGCRKVKHGYRYKRLYSIWQSMKKRCSNPNHKFYKYYGGKGISVCSEWMDDFSTFKNWSIANGYDDCLTIDRINSNAGYSPDNCQWITAAENTRKADYERWHKN